MAAVTFPDAKTRRGTTNTNVRGSVYGRRARKAWLVQTYRANVDVAPLHWSWREKGRVAWEAEVGLEPRPVPLGTGEAACRCYRCGALLTVETVTVDRIIPGCKGGTYRRNNIRPACSTCNESTGGALGASRKAAAHA